MLRKTADLLQQPAYMQQSPATVMQIGLSLMQIDGSEAPSLSSRSSGSLEERQGEVNLQQKSLSIRPGEAFLLQVSPLMLQVEGLRSAGSARMLHIPR